MNKRGQLTFFVIIVLSIAFIILFLVINFNSEKEFKNYKGGSEFEPIYLFAENCLKETAIQGTYYIGKTGGYLIPFKFSTNEGVAYYYIDGKYYVPTKERIESETSNYIKNFFDYCINDFSDFPGFVVNVKDIDITTFIEDENIFFEVNYPLNIKKGDSTYDVENFEFKLPIRIGLMHNISDQIIQKIIKNEGDLCISCIDKLADENNIYINITDYGNDTKLFVLDDPLSNITGTNFKYSFVSK